MITRWDKWFSEDNLNKDKRILAAQHSKSVEKAAQVFLARDKNIILDLACGVGRDSFHLESCGLGVTGVDASFNALRVVQRFKTERGVVLRIIMADARHLPFMNNSFTGVYCFGLLHEFVGERKDKDVQGVMGEVRRLLTDKGILVLTVQAGDPDVGLPAVQKYTQQMFEDATIGLHKIKVEQFDDIGCTARTDYHIWYGVFEK